MDLIYAMRKSNNINSVMEVGLGTPDQFLRLPNDAN